MLKGSNFIANFFALCYFRDIYCGHRASLYIYLYESLITFFISEFPLQTQHSKLDFCIWHYLRTYINDKHNQRKVTLVPRFLISRQILGANKIFYQILNEILYILWTGCCEIVFPLSFVTSLKKPRRVFFISNT